MTSETEIGQALGIPDPIGTAERELGPGPGHGGGMLSEEDIDKLARMAHDVRVDVRVLADAMHRVADAEPATREAALEAVPSTSGPHLESGPRGPHRAVHLSRVAHIDARGVRFGYRSAGQGHPLLMIMGAGGVMATWDPLLVEALALAGRRVTVFDNRGIGTSAPLGDPEALTIVSMADDVIAILDALGIDSADLLGWGMGGYIAQEVALRAPDRVSALILAATDAGGPEALGAGGRATDREPAESTDAELARLSFPDGEDGAGAARAWIERVASQPGATSEWFRVPRQTLVAQRVAEGPGGPPPTAAPMRGSAPSPHRRSCSPARRTRSSRRATPPRWPRAFPARGRRTTRARGTRSSFTSPHGSHPTSLTSSEADSRTARVGRPCRANGGAAHVRPSRPTSSASPPARSRSGRCRRRRSRTRRGAPRRRAPRLAPDGSTGRRGARFRPRRGGRRPSRRPPGPPRAE